MLASQLCADKEPCLSKDVNPRFTYHAVSFDANGAKKTVAGSAKYNPWAKAISDGNSVSVAPGATATTSISVNLANAALTRPLGLMVVTFDNKSGREEAQLIPISR